MDDDSVLVGSQSLLLSVEALRALSLAGRRAWVLAPEEHRPMLERSRWCLGVLPLPDGRGDDLLRAALPRALEQAAAEEFLPADLEFSIAAAGAKEELAGTTVFPVPSADQLRRLDDKSTFAEIAAELGLPVPPTVVVRSFDDAVQHGLSYPILIKPTSARNGEGIRRCDRPADLLRQLGEWPEYPQVLQSYVPGHDVHCTVLTMEGQPIAWEAHAPEHRGKPYRGCRFFRDERLLDIALRLAGPMNYTGLLNLDFLQDRQGGLWLLECNPRLYARLSMAAQAGVNFVQLGMDAAAGHRPDRVVACREGTVYSPGALPGLMRHAQLRSLVSPGGLGAIRMAAADPWLTRAIVQHHRRANA